MFSGARTDVHHIIRISYGILVMFHHNQRIAVVSQRLQGFYELVVVSLMQSDGRLIQNVEYPHETGPDLGGQPDSLGFSSRQGARITGQIEIIQSHIHQEAESGMNFIDDLLADDQVPLGRFIAFYEFQGFIDGKGGEFIDVLSSQGHRKHFRFQPGSVAGGAGVAAHELLDFTLDVIRTALQITSLQVVDFPFIGIVVLSSGIVLGIEHLELDASGSIEKNVHDVVWQILDGCIEIEFILLGQCLKDSVGPGILFQSSVPPGSDGPFHDALLSVRNDQVLINLQKGTQAVAVLAFSVGRVEGEEPWLQLFDADVVVRTGELLRELQVLSINDADDDVSFSQLQRLLDGFGEPSFDVVADHKTVDDRLDVMLQRLLEIHLFLGNVDDGAIDSRSYIPCFLDGFQHLLVFTLLPLDHGCKNLHSGSFRKLQNLIHHLIHTLRGYLLAAYRAVRYAQPCIEQSQIVIDFRDGTHSGSGVLGCGLLVDGDGRAEPFNGLHIRLVHLTQKLSGIGRQRFHIASLPFRIKRVKSQR